MSLAELVITSVKVEGRTKSEVARDYKISRFWVQQLVKRFEAEGEAAFQARSRRPHHNTLRPHRAINRHTPTEAYTARPKARPANPISTVHYRVRRDRIDTGGVITIRYDSRLRHIGLGREHRGKRVLALIADRDIRIVDQETGELLRELTLDADRDYQPLGRPPGPHKQHTAPPADGVNTGRRPPAGPRP